MGNQSKSRKPANDGFSAPAASKKTAKSGKKTSISVICMVLVLALCVGVIVYTKVADSGIFYRTTVSVSSENFEVNNAMMSYFFNSQYQQMASTLEQMGVNLSVNLKDQKYSGDMSWFDYLMKSVTIPQVERILVLCEAAKAAGFEMDEHQKEHVEEAITSIDAMAESYAAQSGVAKSYYLRSVYGYGINMDDIRDAIELNQLAAAYSEKLVDSYEYTEEEWNTYLEENRDDFLVIDYVSYTYSSKDFEEDEEAETSADTAADTTAADTTVAESTAVAGGASDAEDTTAADTTAATTAEKEEEGLAPAKQAAFDAASDLVRRMSLQEQNEKALEIFNNTVKEHLQNVVYADTEDSQKKAESVQSAMDATVSEAVANDDSSEFLKFAFDDERSEEVYIASDDTNGNYTVYCITKDPYIEEYTTRNVRVIALSASEGNDIEEARDSVLKEFEEGEKTEDAFAALAETHSADATAHENGGLYENQGKGDLGVEELDEWLFAEDRKAGDYTSASNGETGTSEVMYVVYYVGEGLVKWQRDVDSAMVSEAYEAEYAELEKAHTVNTDMAEAYKIPSQAGL